MSVTLRHEGDVVARGGQPAAEHVEGDAAADVPDVRRRLHGGTAQVDADTARLEGDEVADRAGSGVVEAKGHRPNSTEPAATPCEE